MKRKMTSKEALQKLSYVSIFQNVDSNMIADTCCCVYVGNLCELYDSAVNIIKKDLEILEILKKHYDVNFLEVSPNYFIAYSVYKDDEDFKKIKEWLNEKEKEERMEND